MSEAREQIGREAFRAWVIAHADEHAHIWWENWAYKFEQDGRLIGWFWGHIVVEIDPAGTAPTVEASEICGALERIAASHQLGLGMVIDAASQELGIVLRAIDPVQVTAIDAGDDRRECCMGAAFQIAYDDPSDPAEHDDRRCPIHDEPAWRL